MNIFTGIGRLGRDAETKYTQAGKPVTTFAVAIEDGFGDNKVTSWLDCAMFGERGEKLAGYIRKGDRIGVTGSIRLDTYTTRDGAEKSKISPRVADVTLLGDKREGQSNTGGGHGGSRGGAPQRQRPAPATQQPTDDFADDDLGIPFIRQSGHF